MAFGITTATNINNSGNVLGITCPAVSADDLIVLAVTVASSSRTMTFPTGFAELSGFPNVPGYQTRTAWKISDGTEGGTSLDTTVSGGALKISGICAAITGSHATAPIDGHATSSEATVDTDKVLPQLVATAGSMQLSIIGNARGGASPQVSTYTAPSPLTKQAETFTSELNGANSIALATDLTPADTTFGPDTWTYDQNASGGGFTIAIAIAPATGTRNFLRDTQTEGGTGGTVYDLSETQGTGATLGSGNTQLDVFTEVLRWQKAVGDTVEGTSFPTSIDMSAVSHTTLLYRWRVQRISSLGVVQASSAYSGEFNDAAIHAESLSLATTWAAGDRLALSLELRKNGGGGNRSITVNVNDADTFLDAEFAASGDATATPGAISTITTLPAATTSAGSTVEPAAVATVATLPATTVSIDATVTPSTIAATTSLPQATPLTSGGATATPATITATVALPSATPSTGSTATPGTVATTAALPGAIASTGATATPSAIATTASLPQATPQAGGNVTAQPDTVATTAALPQAAPTAHATVSPSTITLVTVIPQATPGLPVTTTPGVITGTIALPQAATVMGATATPGTITTPVALPGAGVNVGVGPATLAAAVAFEVPFVGAVLKATSTATVAAPTGATATVATPATSTPTVTHA